MPIELKSYQVGQGDQTNQGYTPDDQDEIQSPNNVTIQIKNGRPGDIDTVTDFDEEPPTGRCALCVFNIRQNVVSGLMSQRIQIQRCVIIIILCLYFAYFGYCMYFRFGDEGSIRLLVCTVFGVLLAFSLLVAGRTRNQRRRLWERSLKPCVTSRAGRRCHAIFSLLLKIAVFCVIAAYIIFDVAIDHPQNLIAVAGQAIYIIIFFVFSISPAKVRWHTIFWGFALQYILALIILRQEWGFQIFKYLGDRVGEFLQHSDAGAIFMFSDPLISAHIFAFTVLPIVVFFYTMISILYYLGVMQFVVRVLGRALAFSMDTTPAESLNAAGNIFVGMTEAPLMIGPFLKDMTSSELHAVMTGGFATIAGSVLGAYVSFGVPANHLISASVMSAPAALAISKLAYPEVEVSKSTTKDFDRMEKAKERNIIEAATAGATASTKLVAAIAVNIIAFLSLLNFVNATLVWCGERAGIEGFTLEFICSYVFFPVAFFMGTDVADCRKIAELIGVKTFTNEFIAYQKLAVVISNGDALANYTSFFNNTAHWYWNNGNVILNNTRQELVGGVISSKSEVIATYALCGFSNFGSIGILLGAMGAIVPTRKRDLTRMVVRAMISGTVACFLTACIAGLLYKDY
ncbi:solute carrier family 28 member 3-like [Mizuhopecten yessoensis]|uniref:Sodium/nucleoside cotransporter n=1 Tax=Mizuhopecten yessoensis TaxID=6573 RepID=A0A210Q1G5_MIZYE|nr:solute carrier family 28 member 3-like [Mizuhopecten yessoensis]XP_021369775.1 solute carrier family 28 member 3-like [Mizuhopecten yessoensis]XP_021369776.1 solute carrier family 28 member 3-like [Mizuhopecten yessoensis]OWF42578.1 Solute carrier family 28 member 3 [Mizuhopecten yessoensis]